ncbi:MAG: hypothetical protein M3374_01820, partial [Pseudomonadota bacterium]|nr:hypothetical protein [Pseudomonadota bacterium]
MRGRPVGVLPVMAATTCCIAASREAKDCGVKTGTPAWEALERCPDIMLVEARPARYIELHHQLMAAIEDCIPIHGKPLSIDEVACRLIGRERERDNAVAIARKIKQTLIERQFSPAIRCSIGIAPNTFLAKTATEMAKVDGLTVLEPGDLPQALHRLELNDLCGIGPSMGLRLRKAGIDTVAQLCAAPRQYLRAVWGGIEGERFWAQLRGIEPSPRACKPPASVGHSHVLGPPMRTPEGMRSVLFKLLAKAAMRMRREACLAQGMAIRIRFVGVEARYSRDIRFAALDDTPTLLLQLGQALEPLLRAAKSGRWQLVHNPPLSVAVTLVGLQPEATDTRSLFGQRPRSQALTQLLDSVNGRYGNNRLYFAAMQNALSQQAAPMRIPFSHIPQKSLDDDIDIRSGHLDADGEGEELWHHRLRQFNVLAESAHREARGKPKKPSAPPYGAGGWRPALVSCESSDQVGMSG